LPEMLRICPIAQSDLPAATQASTSLYRAVIRMLATGQSGRASPRRIALPQTIATLKT
jgi:hypothetical protein